MHIDFATLRGARMKIIKLRVRTDEEWQELASADSEEAMFVPTTDELSIDQPIIIELSSPRLPNKVMIRGQVRSWRPALPRMRIRAGAVVAFEGDEQPKLVFVRDVFSGKRQDVPRRRHNRLPVSVSVRYRIANTASYVDSAISEIGVGGALLTTATPLPIDTDLILEVTPPGAAAPIAISGKVSYHVPTGGSGLKFVSRDSDGARRLRELIRRLRAS
jgi:Tfp pilus assembly protein PilZ